MHQTTTPPTTQAPASRRYDAGTVRVSDRDIAGLMLCGEMYALQPASLDDVHAVRGALTEEPFPVLRRGGRDGPDASARAVPREPEHGRMTGVDRPHQRLRLRLSQVAYVDRTSPGMDPR